MTCTTELVVKMFRSVTVEMTILLEGKNSGVTIGMRQRQRLQLNYLMIALVELQTMVDWVW